MPEPSRKKPLVTANQVTITRLALLPVGCWLLYQVQPLFHVGGVGVTGQWISLVFMTLVGCTDFVDGWLARRHGPTVLGGLMDPIADKVFIALVMLPMIDLDWLPWWVIWLVFAREFVITAARTTYSRREVPLKTTYLAKVKTWFQMISGALIFLVRIGGVPYVRFVGWAGCIGAVVGGLAFFAVKRRMWKGSVVFTLSFGALAGTCYVSTVPELTLGLGLVTVAITWASGGAYLSSLPELLRRQPRVDRHDLVRLVAAIVVPFLSCAVVGEHRIAAWPVFTLVALEFSVGGLDNLLAHQKQLVSWQGWGVRAAAQTGLLGAAWLLCARASSPASLATAEMLAIGALAVTAISVGITFFRNREAYLGPAALAPISTAKKANAA